MGSHGAHRLLGQRHRPRYGVRTLVTMLLVVAPCATGMAQSDDEGAIAWGALACEAGAPLEERVRALLPRERSIPEGFRAEAGVAREGEGYRLVVELSDGTRREVVGERCESLLDAAVLVVAVAIDPSAIAALASEAVAPPEPEPLPAALPPPQRGRALSAPDDPPPPAPLEREAPRPPSVRLGAGAQVVFAAGTLPEPLPGPALELMVGYDAAVLRAGFFYLPESRAAYDEVRGATIDLIAARLALCGRFELSPLAFELCAEGEAGDLRASGYGLDHPIASDNAWGGAGASARARVAIVGPLGLSVMLGVVFPFDRPTFVIEGLGDVFTPEPAALRALAGIDVEIFP